MGGRVTSSLLSRLLLGALGGIGGTVTMTAVMRRLHSRMHPEERYPLPPREIVRQVLPDGARRSLPESSRQSLTLAAHFGYGAFTGALFSALAPGRGPVAGAAYGVMVWALSYLGWIPAAGILDPATRHPRSRNLLMILAHAVWGAMMAATVEELERSSRDIFGKGAARDAARRR